MSMKLEYVTVLVRDQNAALKFYTEKLGFEKKDDDRSVPGMRWLSVAPKGGDDCVRIALQRPSAKMMGAKLAKELMSRIGKNPTWVIQTDDCKGMYEQLKDKGVKFTSPPEDMPWGVSCLFVDLYGNPYNLVEPKQMPPSP